MGPFNDQYVVAIIVSAWQSEVSRVVYDIVRETSQCPKCGGSNELTASKSANSGSQ